MENDSDRDTRAELEAGDVKGDGDGRTGDAEVPRRQRQQAGQCEGRHDRTRVRQG
jgi:hypothetical protein